MAERGKPMKEALSYLFQLVKSHCRDGDYHIAVYLIDSFSFSTARAVMNR